MSATPHRFLLLAILIVSGTAHAVKPARSLPEYRVKAAYLYNFIKFVSWPAQEPQNKNTILVCIAGTDPFGAELSFMHNKVLQNRTIKVQTVTLEQLGACQIVFISRSQRSQLAAVFTALQSKPILTVSDIEGFAEGAGMIGFAMNESQLHLKINLHAAQAVGLEISSKLLEIATVVPGDNKSAGVRP